MTRHFMLEQSLRLACERMEEGVCRLGPWPDLPAPRILSGAQLVARTRDLMESDWCLEDDSSYENIRKTLDDYIALLRLSPESLCAAENWLDRLHNPSTDGAFDLTQVAALGCVQ